MWPIIAFSTYSTGMALNNNAAPKIHSLGTIKVLFCLSLWACGIWSCQTTPASNPLRTPSDDMIEESPVSPNDDQNNHAWQNDMGSPGDSPHDGRPTDDGPANSSPPPTIYSSPPSLKPTGQKPSTTKTSIVTPISSTEAAKLLYPEITGRHKTPAWKRALKRCPQKIRKKRVPCLLRNRYAKDPRAVKLAISLYSSVGIVAGLRRRMVRRGGWRFL